MPTHALKTDPIAETEQWETDGATCQLCGVELALRSDDEPGPQALRIADVALICERCEGELEAQEAESKLQERVLDSKLPPALRKLRWPAMEADSGEREGAIEAAKHWASAGGRLLLFGDVGTGKTRLAATAVWDRLERGQWVTWVSVPILLAQIGAAFGDEDKTEAIGILTGKGALVLDDLDKARPTEWGKEQLFAAIDRRIQSGAPLLITTNLEPEELGKRYGKAIMSRVASARQIRLTGRDRRLGLPGV